MGGAKGRTTCMVATWALISSFGRRRQVDVEKIGSAEALSATSLTLSLVSKDGHRAGNCWIQSDFIGFSSIFLDFPIVSCSFVPKLGL